MWDVFEHAPHAGSPGRSSKHSAMVSLFLAGRANVKAEEIMDLIYNQPGSKPKDIRSTSDRPASEVVRPNAEPMACRAIREWATWLVEGVIDKEAKIMASKEGGSFAE